MTILRHVPENYFDKPKYRKNLNINGTKVDIHVSHFKGTLSVSSPMYTSIRGSFNKNNIDYEFKVSYDETDTLEDFDIEFEKISRKWEKVIRLIIEKIEVD